LDRVQATLRDHPDGFTLAPNGSEVKAGIPVGAEPQATLEVDPAALRPADVRRWLRRNGHLIARDGYGIGGWTDETGKIVLDVVKYDHASPADALAYAKERGEQAIYDIGAGEEHAVQYDGGEQERLARRSKYLERRREELQARARNLESAHGVAARGGDSEGLGPESRFRVGVQHTDGTVTEHDIRNLNIYHRDLSDEDIRGIKKLTGIEVRRDEIPHYRAAFGHAVWGLGRKLLHEEDYRDVVLMSLAKNDGHIAVGAVRADHGLMPGTGYKPGINETTNKALAQAHLADPTARPFYDTRSRIRRCRLFEVRGG
jgi:hypothetical protein